MSKQDFDGILIELIKDIKQKKIENKQIPNHVMIGEVMEEIRVSLRRLNKNGAIKAGKTINSVYFDI